MQIDKQNSTKLLIVFILMIVLQFYAHSQTILELDSMEMHLSKLSKTTKVDMLNFIAWELIKTNRDWTKIDTLSKQALILSKQLKYIKGEADALLNISYSAFNTDENFEKSTTFLQQAMAIYQLLNDTLGLAYTNQQIGSNLFFKGQLTDIEMYYKNALLLFYKLKEPMRIDEISSLIQTYYMGYTQKKGCVKFYNDLKKDFENSNNVDGIGFIYYKLLNTYLSYKDNDSLEIYIRKSIQILPSINDVYTKGILFFAVGEYYFYNEKPDSAFYYYTQAQQLYEKSGNYYVGAMAYYLPGNFYAKQKSLTEAEKCYDKGIKIANSIKNKELVISMLSELGTYNFSLNNYAIALKYYLQMLKIVQLVNIKEYIMATYIQISEIYKVLKEYDKALEYAQLSLLNVPNEKANYLNGIALRNIGILFYLKSDYDTAISYLDQSETILKANNIQRSVLITNYFSGLCCLKMKNYKKALDFFNEALELKKTTGVKIQIAGTISISVYGALARLFYEQNNLDEALKYGLMSIEEYKEDLIQDKNSLKDDYYTIYQIYKAMKNVPQALFYFENYMILKEQIDSDENSRKITGLEIAAATEKQEKENELLKKDNQLKEKEVKQQSFARNVFITGFVLMTLLVFFILRNYQQKKKANTLLKKQKEEIQAQSENLKKANIEITAQKNEIQKSHNNITASISYAKRIQNAVLPTKEIIETLLPDYLIFFKPRDIVSGDFYFIKQYKNHIFLAAADCTGHGVPGAFMSMLGMALLNEIIRKNEIQNSSQILDELRLQVKNSLQQTGQKGEQQDGMDIAFVSVNIDNYLMSFAGANNSLIVFRDNQLIEFKGDKMPVGVYRNEQAFTNQIMQLKNDDILYLFSDGYYSQFRQITKEPMKSKRFKELLTNIHSLDFETQKQKLEIYLQEWKGTENQVDDILILGFKINLLFERLF